MRSIFDVRALLQLPWVYIFFSCAVGQGYARQVYVRDYIRPSPGDRILDIGCGTADILEYLPAAEYVGFDRDAAYIQQAQKRFGNRGTFFQATVKEWSRKGKEQEFDIVMAIGVIHHLPEEEVLELLQVARNSLRRPKGRFIAVDPGYTAGQSPLERFLLSCDRGEYVRDIESYKQLLRSKFEKVKVDIRPHLLRIPYTLFLAECSI